MAASSAVVPINALMRINSVRSTSRVSACSNSAETAVRCLPALLPQNPSIGFSWSFRDGPKDQTAGAQLRTGNLEILICAIAHHSSLVSLAPRNDVEILT